MNPRNSGKPRNSRKIFGAEAVHYCEDLLYFKIFHSLEIGGECPKHNGYRKDSCKEGLSCENYMAQFIGYCTRLDSGKDNS